MATKFYIMPGRFRRETQRPDGFTLQAGHGFYQSLLFAGLGAWPGTNRFHDSSPYGNHGVLTNMAPLTDWLFDSYLGRQSTDFDGSNDNIIMSNPAFFAYPVSAAAWVRPRDLSTTPVAQHIIDLAATGAGYGGMVILNTDGGVGVQILHDKGIKDIPSLVGANAWSHWGVALASATVGTFYLNGQALATVALDTNSYGSAFQIGSRASAARPYNGRLSDIIVWAGLQSPSAFAALAGPSNVMLNGLIVPARRRLWGVTTAAGHPTIKRFGGVPFAAGSGKGVW